MNETSKSHPAHFSAEEKQVTRTRKAKIHALYRRGTIYLCRKADTSKNVPWLNVNGHWLEQAGFKIGDQIEIDVSRNRLVIKKLSIKKENGNG